MIAFDNSTSVTGVLSGTGGTLSHTTSSGADRILIAMITVTANVDITAVTYNGVALTKLTDHQTVFSTTWWHDCWYLVNPASGTNNLSVTTASSVNKYISVATYTGVDQTTPINASNSGQNTGTPFTLTTTSTVNNVWGVIGGANVDASWDASGVNSTLRSQYFGIVGISDSNGPLTPAGSFNQTMPYGAGTRTTGGTQIMLTPVLAPSSGMLMFF